MGESKMPSCSFFALLLLPIFATRSSSLNVWNCSSYLRLSHSVYINWEPPLMKRTCELKIDLVERVSLVVSYSDGDTHYSTTSACVDSRMWDCEPGCRGLFYSRESHGIPILATVMNMPVTVTSSFLRLRYCHSYSGLPYPRVRFHISSDRTTTGDYQDPVWRVLGPVLATVCMVATVFLVCVCYVQHAYQRAPQCCRWITGRSHSTAAEAGAAANASGEDGSPGGHARMHRHVDPLPDQPPAYDDFRKYHRPCSFGQADRSQPRSQLPTATVPVPPSYTDAVKSLQRKQENEQRARARFRMQEPQPRNSVRRSLSCGADRNAGQRVSSPPPPPTSGVDNQAFLREENAPPAFTEATNERRAAVSVEDLSIDVDLGEGAATLTRDTSASNC